MSKQTLIVHIFRHAPKYISASVISSGAALLMTKYYTAVFTPAQYGVLALYLVLFNYVKTFTSLNMDSSATRFYFDYRATRRDEYLSTIFWFITAIAAVVLMVGLGLMPWLADWIAPGSTGIYLVTLLGGIGAVYVSFLIRILFNEQRSTSVLKHTLLQTVVNHGLSVVLISGLHLGVMGRMAGQGSGYLANILTLMREFAREGLFRLRRVFNARMAQETFWLSFPSIIASVQTVLFVYLDRIFLKYYQGDASVGVYTLGYMLGQGLAIVYEAISQAILPRVYAGMNEHYEETLEELERFSYRYYAGLIVLTAAISLMSPLIVRIFSNEAYSGAARVMPFVMAGFMMGGFYKIPSLVLGYHKVVWFYPVLAFVVFVINGLSNWWLVPTYGMIGAAFSSFLAYFVNSAVITYISAKYFHGRLRVFFGSIYLFSLIVVTLVWSFFL